MDDIKVTHEKIVGGKFFIILREISEFPAGTICTKLVRNVVPDGESAAAALHNSVKRGKTFYVPADEIVIAGK